MTQPARPSPTSSLRALPPAIHVALGIDAVGALAVAVATLRASGASHERFLAVERWHVLDMGCSAASTILLALGLLELGKRCVGSARVLTQVAAALGLATLAWLGLRPLIAALDPGFDSLQLFYTWLGRGIGASVLASAVLLTIAADAWRRAPVAAAVLVVLAATSGWLPVVGTAISDLVGFEPGPRQLYGLARVGLQVVATLLVTGALAAGGRDPAPEPRAAAAGLRLARRMLILRLVAAVALVALLIAGRSQKAAVIAAFGGPAAAVLSMLVFAIAVVRVAGARIDGMPRLLLVLGAALTLWWTAIQLDQVGTLIRTLKGASAEDPGMASARWFSISGPVAATLGLALVGSAIAAFASRRGDVELHANATRRTAAFTVATLSSIGFQFLLARQTSLGGALAVTVLSATAALVGLVALAGLLDRAAASIEAMPGLPPARVVDR